MFGKLMNSFYYGKSGKGDFRKEDLPKTRWQLFWSMLKVRLSGLCRLNLMTLVAFIPLIIVLILFVENVINSLVIITEFQNYLLTGAFTESFTEEMLAALAQGGVVDEASGYAYFFSVVFASLSSSLLYLIPCILITGPVQAGMAYVTRNWSRDEHAFIWSDFKDAVKKNWKQGLAISAISSLLPIVVYVGYTYYGDMAEQSLFFIVPQMLIVMVAVVWFLGTTFMYPMMVSYEVKFKALVKNSIMLAIARLPHTVGVRIATVLPIAVLMALITLIFGANGLMYALLALLLYYVLFGFALARFVFASFTNGVFDKYINAHIEGAQVNRGMAAPEEDEEEEDDEQHADE